MRLESKKTFCRNCEESKKTFMGLMGGRTSNWDGRTGRARMRCNHGRRRLKEEALTRNPTIPDFFYQINSQCILEKDLGSADLGF